VPARVVAQDEDQVPGGVSAPRRELALAKAQDAAVDPTRPAAELPRMVAGVASAAAVAAVLIQAARKAPVPAGLAWAAVAGAAYLAWAARQAGQPTPQKEPVGNVAHQLAAPSEQWVAGVSESPTVYTSGGRRLPVYY
jgi:hypothetical protein